MNQEYCEVVTVIEEYCDKENSERNLQKVITKLSGILNSLFSSTIDGKRVGDELLEMLQDLAKAQEANDLMMIIDILEYGIKSLLVDIIKSEEMSNGQSNI